VAFWKGEFTMKYLDLTHKKDGYIELRPANDDYPVFRIEEYDQFEVWGVVIHLIRTFERI
jgi:DNA polymerase V